MTEKKLLKLKKSILVQIDSANISIAYISGPISTYPGSSVKENIRKFHLYEKSILEDGYFVINPASVGDLEAEGFSYDDILDMWLDILSSAKIEHVFMLPNWHRSNGATKEHELCLKLGKHIHYIEQTD